MTYRVTPSYLTNQLNFYNRIRTSNLANLQYQATTGLKLSRPSDDPSAAQQLFSLKRTLSSIETDNINIQNVEGSLNTSVANLQEAHNILRAAQRLSIQGQQATDESEREVYAIEADRLLERLAAIGNATERGRFQYGGQNDKQTPYVLNNESTYPPYTYQGADAALGVTVSQNIAVDIYYNGEEIFGTASRSKTIFIGPTGARAGQGTDNERFQSTLEVAHTLTTYAAGSGVVAGTGSVGGDSIIGETGTHQLTINDTSGTGASGTIQLNDGTEFDWTAADDNLEITGPNGGKVFVDTQNITAGFNGTIDITADGTLSTDGGATTTAIDFSGNQQVLNSESNRVTNIDSSDIRSIGTDHIEYRGTSDAFTAIAELRDDLRNTRKLNNSQVNESLKRRGDDLERHADQALKIVGEQSVSLEALVALKSRNDAYYLEVANITNEIEAADLAEVVIQLQHEENLLQYSYAVSSTILSQNILDYLR